MHIKIDGREFTLPASLMEVTLGSRIAYDNTYGRALREQLANVIAMPDGMDRTLALLEYQAELAAKTLSHFGAIPYELVLQVHADDVLMVYEQFMHGMSAEVDFTDEAFELHDRFYWNNEVWMIAAPVLENGSKMKTVEFVHGMQWIKNMIHLGEEKWEALLLLACIYFRKEGEGYSKDFDKEGSERYELLKKLPLEYGLNVGFFLSASLSSYLKTFPSSSPVVATAVLSS